MKADSSPPGAGTRTGLRPALTRASLEKPNEESDLTGEKRREDRQADRSCAVAWFRVREQPPIKGANKERHREKARRRHAQHVAGEDAQRRDQATEQGVQVKEFERDDRIQAEENEQVRLPVRRSFCRFGVNAHPACEGRRQTQQFYAF